jgi:membrane peptidoglycan carboxypeptidase
MNVMLRGVVEEGTGTSAAIAGYTPAGKTGTARKPQPGGGYTGPDGVVHYQATFVGFVPAEAPALSIIVIIDDPSKEGIFGGVVAAPAFSRSARPRCEFAVRRRHRSRPRRDPHRPGQERSRRLRRRGRRRDGRRGAAHRRRAHPGGRSR